MTDSSHSAAKIDRVLDDPAASFWLTRDPVDAADDAEVLAHLLSGRCKQILSES